MTKRHAPPAKRGQAAVEFLSTYGFAIVALLVTLGVITYFGIFNLSSLRSNECIFPEGVSCLEFIMDETNANPGGAGSFRPNPAFGGGVLPYFRARISNTYGTNLTLDATAPITLSFEEAPGALNCKVEGSTLAWPSGSNITVWCAVPAGSFYPRQRYDGVLGLNFTQQGGSYDHFVSGTISIIAQ